MLQSVILKGTSPQQNVDSCAPTVATQILKQLMLLKRTCGYPGNPQARPMVKGRHKEISAARVKHMNGSTIKYEGKHPLIRPRIHYNKLEAAG